MTWMRAAAASWLFLTLLPAAAGGAGERPRASGKVVVATVQGETITLDELQQQSAEAPVGTAAPPDAAAQLAVLNRLVNVVLIVQEARRMGLDRLPEVRTKVEAYARVALRDELVQRVVKDVVADPGRVEELYRASVREWKVSAVLFEGEEQARAFLADLASGGDFAALARAYLARGRAKKVEAGALLRREAMDPAIAAAVEATTVGAVSPVVSAKSGPVVLRVEEIRHRDDPAARARAEQIALTERRREVVTAFEEALRKKYVTVNRELLAALDYEAPTPGFDALLRDRRVLAEIKGEKPIIVAELTEALKFQFFHGTAMAAERKRLNARKERVLDGLLHRKVFRKEALRLGLDRTDAYRARIRDHERSALFDAFVRKVVAPDVRLTEDDVRAYYDAHRAEYTSPEMIRIRSLAFSGRAAAEAAAESLRKGADFRWVADHAEGQVPADTPGLLTFDGRPIMTTELPEGVARAVAGARAGDVRVHASAEGHVYVLAVHDVVPAAAQPYEQVRQQVARRVFDARLEKAVEEYAAKLRALSDVRIHLSP